MIRKSILDTLRIQYTNTVTEFVNLAITNQVHKNDFILILQSGQFDEELAKKSKSPLPGFTTGHQFEQFDSLSTQRFLKWYYEHSGFITKNELPKVDIDKELDVHVSMKIESMIYLSFWESDMTLMILYQIVRLVNNERYDWFWRDKLANSTSGNEFLRKNIKNKIRDIYPPIYELLNKATNSQIRNAIAHSQIVPLNNNIKLLNYSENPKKHAPKVLISYEEWEELICLTMTFRGALISSLNEIGMYAKQVPGAGKFNVEIETPNGIEKGSFPLF